MCSHLESRDQRSRRRAGRAAAVEILFLAMLSRRKFSAVRKPAGATTGRGCTVVDGDIDIAMVYGK